VAGYQEAFMAKKKLAIGDLIKGDMSRRAIGEAPKTGEKPAHAETEVKKPSEKKPPVPKKIEAAVNPPPAVKKQPGAPEPGVTAQRQPEVPGGSAGLMAAIAVQASSVGLIEHDDLIVFYDFLERQAIRYIRGFDAGRRFHG
jgi:hypothetical protein